MVASNGLIKHPLLLTFSFSRLELVLFPGSCSWGNDPTSCLFCLNRYCIGDLKLRPTYLNSAVFNSLTGELSLVSASSAPCPHLTWFVCLFFLFFFYYALLDIFIFCSFCFLLSFPFSGGHCVIVPFVLIWTSTTSWNMYPHLFITELQLLYIYRIV